MKNTQLLIDGYVQSALASKALPRLLIQTHRGGWLLDNEGGIHSDGSLLCNAEPRWVEIELIP